MAQNTNSWESAITGYLAQTSREDTPDATSAEHSPQDHAVRPRDDARMVGSGPAVQVPPAPAADAPVERTDARGGARQAPVLVGHDAAHPFSVGLSFRQTQDERLSNRRGDTLVRRAWSSARGFFVADTTPDALARAAASVQRTVPTGRRLVVVGAHGGAGATTLAAALGGLIASLRTDHVTVLGAHADRGSLSRRVGAAPYGDVPAAPISEVLSIIGMGGDADLLEPATGQPRMSLATYPAHGKPPTFAFAQWLCRTRAVVVADAGERPEQAILRDAHAVALCLSPTVDGVHAAGDVLEELRRADVDPRRIVPVIVKTQRDTGLSARSAGKRLDTFEDVLVVPFDRHLATGATIRVGHLGEGARVALTELAGRLIDVSLDGGRQRATSERP